MNSSRKRKIQRPDNYSSAGNSKINVIIYWAPSVIWAAFIFYLSSRTASELPTVGFKIPFADKAAHIILYAILGFLFARSFSKASNARNTAQVIILALAASVAWGAADELHQFFVPTRALDFTDLLADILGAAIGSFVWIRYY